MELYHRASLSRLKLAATKYLNALRHPTGMIGHEASLLRLKKIGFEPLTVYDLGAHHGTWAREASKILPNAEFFLFEANADHAAQLSATGLKYFIAALGSEDRAIKPFYTPKEGISTGASFYRENTSHYNEQNLLTRSVPVARLDTFVVEHRLPLPQLIKLDIQGGEIDALAGAPTCLGNCNALITEVSLVNYNQGSPLFAEVVSWITRRGFFCVDICEIHRWKQNCIFQMDLLFVREQIFSKFSSLGF